MTPRPSPLQTAARFSFWLLAAVVLFLALTPGPLASIIASDIGRHYLAFLILPAVAAYAWPRISLLSLWLGFAVFGGAIEILQYEMDVGRAAQMSDWINDLSATTISLTLTYIALRRSRRQQTA